MECQTYHKTNFFQKESIKTYMQIIPGSKYGATLTPTLLPGWTESTGKSASIWRKRSQAITVLTHTWGGLRRETRRCVATAISLWIMQSTHSSSAQSGAWQGRPSVRLWVPSSLLTRWPLWCSSLSGSGRSSSHSLHLWWRRESSMCRSYGLCIYSSLFYNMWRDLKKDP